MVRFASRGIRRRQDPYASAEMKVLGARVISPIPRQMATDRYACD